MSRPRGIPVAKWQLVPQVVLHLDVNGSLSLGDVAGIKSFGEMAASLAKDLVKREEEGAVALSPVTKDALTRAANLDEEMLEHEYTTYYNSKDLLRAITLCLDMLRGGKGSSGLTLAIRTNGVEHEAAASYLRDLVKNVGYLISEADGSIER